jgi:hypothetical protein
MVFNIDGPPEFRLLGENGRATRRFREDKSADFTRRRRTSRGGSKVYEQIGNYINDLGIILAIRGNYVPIRARKGAAQRSSPGGSPSGNRRQAELQKKAPKTLKFHDRSTKCGAWRKATKPLRR